MNFPTIRKITINDLNSIVEMERKCFDKNTAYNQRQLKYLITKANSNCLAETHQETIRGFIIVLLKRGTSVAGIETLNVDPNFRGQGVGKNLLNATETNLFTKGIEKIRLEVSVGNVAAIKLYEKSGFLKINYLKDFYYNYHFGTRDAFRMVKNLVT